MTLADGTISDNGAGQGGGIYSIGTASLTNVTVSQNDAFELAAGIVADGNITLTNVTISGNRVYFGAGGMFHFAVGTARLTNVTISANTANLDTGGIEGTAILRNTIVSNNTSMSGGNGNCTGNPITSEGHNLEDTDTCGLNGPGDLTNSDPKLGPLADNGGPTQTHALLPGSPAIDTGDIVACPTTDQRGRPRAADGDLDGIPVCDIGSYEFQPLPGITTPTPTLSPTPSLPTPTSNPSRSVAGLPRTGGAQGGSQASIAYLWIGGLLIGVGMTSLFRSFKRHRP